MVRNPSHGEFVLESAPSVNGLWELVPVPWWRTNNARNEVCILAPDSLKLLLDKKTVLGFGRGIAAGPGDWTRSEVA